MAISGIWKKITQGAKAFSAIAALSFVAACGSDDTKPTPCQTDAQCAFGTVCLDDKICGVLPCGAAADCLNGRQDCISLNNEHVCAAVECGCFDCSPCPTGEQCVVGQCVGEGTCSNDAQCNDTDVCDNGACRPCQGSECGATSCETTGCPTGQVCNPTTQACEAAPATGNPCDSCTTSSVNDDCGAGWTCSPLRTGFACLPPCTTGDDCETGWSCQSGACRPASGACEGCTVSGCPAGQACNATSNQCETAKPTCGSCSADWECGEGAACLNGSCKERCEGSCADGSACVASASGVKACDTACDAQCTPACGGTTPICRNGTCVGCNTNNDCSNGQICDVASGQCIGQVQCQAPTPVLLNGNCVECATNADCGTGFCNAQTNTCTNSRCASCVAPYPGCLEIDGDAYCVQCTEDSQCNGGTCDLTAYACRGGTINPAGDCRQVGCQNSSSTSYNLACDQATGLCYDTGGYCDDITAFCPTANGQTQRCVSMLDAMMGGGLGMDGLIPPGTIPGFCGCSSLLPGMGLLVNDCKVSGSLCGDLASFMSGGPSTNPVCWNLSALGGTP